MCARISGSCVMGKDMVMIFCCTRTMIFDRREIYAQKGASSLYRMAALKSDSARVNSKMAVSSVLSGASVSTYRRMTGAMNSSVRLTVTASMAPQTTVNGTWGRYFNACFTIHPVFCHILYFGFFLASSMDFTSRLS